MVYYEQVNILDLQGSLCNRLRKDYEVPDLLT